jgi:glycosyltransferase involved in cell wall biosynthesis
MPRNSTQSRRDPLRVVVIVEDLRLPLDEGAKKASFNLIRAFKNKGASVFVFTHHKNPLLEDSLQLPKNKFLFRFSFVRELRSLSSDVLFYMPGSSGTLGAFVRAAMLKIQSHGKPLALLNLQYRELPAVTRYLGLKRYVDIVFSQSKASTDVFHSYGCKTILLPGGVDHTIFQPVSKQEKHLLRLKYSFQDSDRIVLHIGHCNRDRNVIALTRLIRSGFKAILIASTSTAIDRDLLVELRKSRVTVITDFVENIQHYYQMADCYFFPVFCATSAIDAPLSILEAMACNLPIVTTRFGALPGMFQSGNGFYFGDTDDDMTDMVHQAINEQDCKTVEMAAPYSWNNAASTILKTLDEIGGL